MSAIIERAGRALVPHAETSHWIKDAGPYTPNLPLAGELACDVAIVGGGFTGLATAFHLLEEQPSLRVAVLEGEVVAFGASGRNAGFSMTLFGLEPAITKTLFGRERTVEAHRYMERAVDHVRQMVARHGIRSDYEHPGFLRLATTPAYVRRIQKDLEILAGMGIQGIDWWDEARARAEVDSPLVLGAWHERRCGLLHPAKHVRELKRLAEEAGALVFERTPVTRVERGERFTLSTPGGTVRADRVVFATNAWSFQFQELRRKQVAAFTHIVVTERLSEKQLNSIGWHGRHGLEDARNLVHYFRLTPDDRILMGGSDVTLPFGRGMDHDRSPRTFAQLERDLFAFFPQLRGVKIADRWGGAVSVPLDMVPAIGAVGDERAIYSLGCMGHGVSLTQLNGKTIAHLLLGKKSDLTEVWFVNRRTLPWPPEPLRFVAGQAIKAGLKLQDWWAERGTKCRA